LQLKDDARLGIKRYDIDKDVIQLYFEEVCHSFTQPVFTTTPFDFY